MNKTINQATKNVAMMGTVAKLKVEEMLDTEKAEKVRNDLDEFMSVALPAFAAGINLTRSVRALKAGNRRRGIAMLVLTTQNLVRAYEKYQKAKADNAVRAIENSVAEIAALASENTVDAFAKIQYPNTFKEAGRK